MSTIQDLFQQAQLAEAAYANFYDASGNLITSDDGVKAALITAGFSKDPNNPTQSAQATAFTDRYQVVSQQPNTGSGYSATLFLDKTTGQYTYAIRGTELRAKGVSIAILSKPSCHVAHTLNLPRPAVCRTFHLDVLTETKRGQHHIKFSHFISPFQNPKSF